MTTPRLAVLALALAACHSSHRTTIHGHLSGGVDAQRTETRALMIGAGDRLELSTPHGAIEVRTAPGAAPQLVATIHAGGRTKEEAEQVLASYELDIDDRKGSVRVSFRGDPVAVRDDGARLVLGASVDYSVTLPEGVELQLETRSGDLRATGAFGACRLDTRYGSVELEGATGDVVMHSDSGDLTARALGGGHVTAESGYGAVRLENVNATGIRAASRSGDIVLVSGRAKEIELATDYGAVSVRGAEGIVHASTRSGDVGLSDLHGEVVARSQYGSVAIEGVLTAIEARSSSGDVGVRALAGSASARDWELASGYGRVTLCVPSDFGCQLVASTRYGTVDCAFPLTMDTGKRKNGALRGTVGAGGRTVTLSSASGDLALRQL